MSEAGWVHTVFAFVAIGAGLIVVLIPKGTRWHRTAGHAYVMAMVGVVATSFAMYGLTGGFGPFHVAAIVAGFTVAGGLTSVLFRRPRKSWIEAHATWMSWSYVGLLAALAAESLTRFVMPRVAFYLDGNELWGAFWSTVGVASFTVIGAGWWLIRTRLPAAIAGTPAAMMRDRLALAQEEPTAPAPTAG